MQIGPRIRVGGTLGKVGQKLKKPLLLAGGLAITGGLAGVGPLAGLLGGASEAGGLAAAGGKLGLLKKAGGFLSKHKKDIVDYGALGEGIYDRMQSNRAIDEQQDRYRRLQPLRDQALAQLQAPPPDVSAVFADPAGEQRYRRINVGSGGRY